VQHGPISYDDEIRSGSCLIAIYWAWKYGGYVCFRRTRWHKVPFISWPHFTYLPPNSEARDYMIHFSPLGHDDKISPPIIFRGRVKVGDYESCATRHLPSGG